MTVIVEVGFIDRFEDEAQALLDDFIAWGWHAERTGSCPFWDVGTSYRFRLVLFHSQQLNLFLNNLHTVSIQRFAVRAACHVARFALYPLVGQDVERWVVQQAVQIAVYPRWIVTILRVNDIQLVTGFYHIA